ncbi:MAG: hypothetical protein NTW86_01995 [Candidatus Sumerlaeota bacterium]|nr:hypothetical protein [Candidatus Sumerlaeota bacterium]
MERQIVQARRRAPCLGAQRLKDFFDLPAGVGAIGRVLRQNALTRKRKKKYQKKRDLRAVKARLAAMEMIQVDVKYLDDIPFYVEQMQRARTLPQYQYTARDVKTGGTFLGFADELSEEHACCFVSAVAAHLKRVG